MGNRVMCLKNIGSFTAGKTYFITESGLESDDGYCYTDFLGENHKTLAEQWVAWSSKSEKNFRIVDEAIRRF